MLSPGDGPKQTRQPAALALAWLTWWFGFYSLTVLSFLLGKIRQDFSLSEFQLAWLTGIAIAASGLGG
ncbi:MAG TPA: hypothetical protein PK413_10735, partial [Thermoanaerobaculia bacterium]|nr:hypothetical protein [Thermoanaerobaculia bacterium]